MQLVSKKYFLLLLSAILVVAFGYMALNTLNQKKQNSLSQIPTYEQEITQVQTQSESDNVGDIEKDLNETNLTKIDSELHDIETELNQSY